MLVLFEGIDGVGKTTLAKWLQNVIPDSLYVHEPGGNPNAEKIARVFNGFDVASIHPMTNLLLVSASRAEVMYNTVLPAMEIGRHIVMDRYVPSTLAYQGYGLDISMAAIMSAVQLSAPIEPDIVFYLAVEDADIEKISSRARKTTARAKYNADYLLKVNKAYEKIYETKGQFGFRGVWVKLDALSDLDALKTQIASTLALYGVEVYV